MGGRALKFVETKRLEAREYHALVPAVLDIVAGVVGRDRDLCEIEAYRSKPDFGDMDLLVASDGIVSSYKDDLAEAFRSREVVRNGNVTSFDFDGFQVDVIAIEQKSFDFAKSYFAWNDLGNLMGRIAHKMGLKYAFEGLYLPLREGDQKFDEVIVTRDVDSALETLGYDPVRYRQGFDTLEDIFVFAASTPFFNPDIYLLENRNAIARRRDAKRKTYAEFLDWIEDPKGLSATLQEPEAGWFSFPRDKSAWISRLQERYPTFSEDLHHALERKRRREQAGEIFNGHRISTLTGLSGAELGGLIQEIKSVHGQGDAFVDWVLGAGPQGVDKTVEEIAASLESRSESNSRRRGPRP